MGCQPFFWLCCVQRRHWTVMMRWAKLGVAARGVRARGVQKMVRDASYVVARGDRRLCAEYAEYKE